MFRDAKHGAALRHLPSGYPEVNRAWMWGALLAASLTGWLHQLTATTTADGSLVGHGVRDGQAMIATLRHRLIRVPGPADPPRRPRSSCAYHPATTCSPRSSPGSGPCPSPPDLRLLEPRLPDLVHGLAAPNRRKAPQTANPAPAPGPSACPLPESWRTKIISEAGTPSPRYSRNRV